ncbi:MAG: magnesium transporter CorA family protein [Clostridiales bacterium]|nr:magnesium transporter CorA family protein [Clostridiales bacterium]
MIKYYIENNHKVEQHDDFPDSGWISLIAPTDEELRKISMEMDIPMEACRAALDLDERSRIEIDDNYRMLLVNIPTREETSENELYTTIPLAIILTGSYVVTVCSKDTHILRGFANGSERDFHPGKKSRFVFQILYATARRYLIYLRLIEKKIDAVELEFTKHQKNREIMELMKLQKSLVYFTTGLRSNESVLEKLVRTEVVKKYEEDADLLEDVMVENKQAIEMAKIHTEILANLSNTFASVVSNNLNVAMKVLAIITIVMEIPNMVYGALGMNVGGIPMSESPYGFVIMIGSSLVISLVALFILLRIKMFK